MDLPFVRGGELPDEIVLNEELDDMFAQIMGGKGPDGRSLSFDLDGGIVNGQLGYPEVAGLVRLVAASYGRLLSDRLPE